MKLWHKLDFKFIDHKRSIAVVQFTILNVCIIFDEVKLKVKELLS